MSAVDLLYFTFDTVNRAVSAADLPAELTRWASWHWGADRCQPWGSWRRSPLICTRRIGGRGHLATYLKTFSPCHRDSPAASIASKACLASGPPRYSPKVPSLRTTRWQGTTSGSGLWEHALAAARTADGLPAAFATAV